MPEAIFSAALKVIKFVSPFLFSLKKLLREILKVLVSRLISDLKKMLFAKILQMKSVHFQAKSFMIKL